MIDLNSKQTEKSVTISSFGNFNLKLNYFKDYKISISKDGYYEKGIIVSTFIPRKEWLKDSIFPPYCISVMLYKSLPDTILSFEGKIIEKILYSPNGIMDLFESVIFINDDEIEKEINKALKIIGNRSPNQLKEDTLEHKKKR